MEAKQLRPSYPARGRGCDKLVRRGGEYCVQKAIFTGSEICDV